MRFDIIYADPAWSYRNKSRKRTVEKHYNTISLEKMKGFPVNELSKKNSILFIWITFPNLEEGLELIKAWGFKYITCAFNWIKKNKSNNKFFMGMGNYTRSNSELCLIAKKGKGLKRIGKSVKQIICTHREKHSKKPKETRERIVELYGNEVSKIELFARERDEGWYSLGNELDGLCLNESILRMIKGDEIPKIDKRQLELL